MFLKTFLNFYNLHLISTYEEPLGVHEDNYSHSSEYISKIGYDGKNHLCYAVESDKYIDGDYESEEDAYELEQYLVNTLVYTYDYGIDVKKYENPLSIHHLYIQQFGGAGNPKKAAYT